MTNIVNNVVRMKKIKLKEKYIKKKTYFNFSMPAIIKMSFYLSNKKSTQERK